MESVDAAPGGAGHQSLRVLICDDEPSIRRLIRLNLELEGHQVEEVADGHGAMERLRDLHVALPDVMLLDGHMAPLDGWSVMDQVRADPRLLGLPVVLVSAGLHAIDADQVDEAGFVDVLAKPFDPDDLLEVVSRAAGRTPPLGRDPRIGA